MSEQATSEQGRSAYTNFETGSEVASSAAYAFPSKRDASAFIEAMRTQAHSCQSWDETSDGHTVTGSPGDLSFPTLGDETYAYRVTAKSGSDEATSDYEFARKGNNVTAIGYGGLFRDTDTTQKLAELAYAKLPGQSA